MWIALARACDRDPLLKPFRTRVASLGAATASDLVGSNEAKLALAVADEVIARFGSSEELLARAAVAVAMQVRIVALRRRRRILRAARAGSDLMSFVGPEPEPEVIEVMRSVNAEMADRWLQNARRFET
jgi:hypothetical protein